jgi:hypothetical protein
MTSDLISQPILFPLGFFFFFAFAYFVLIVVRLLLFLFFSAVTKTLILNSCVAGKSKYCLPKHAYRLLSVLESVINSSIDDD